MSRMGDQGAAASGLTDKAQEVSQNLRDLGSQVRDTAREKYDELGGQAKEYYDQGREMAQEWETTLENYVKEKPVQALLIAAGVGLLLGALWKRS